METNGAHLLGETIFFQDIHWDCYSPEKPRTRFHRAPCIEIPLFECCTTLGVTLTHHVDELGQLELDADPEHVAGVDHGPHQLVVVGEQHRDRHDSRMTDRPAQATESEGKGGKGDRQLGRWDIADTRGCTLIFQVNDLSVVVLLTVSDAFL
ncbi:FeMo cofactor biosynthesis protein NifB [Frankliniella fusca]|uniref:FeMo cofactor biosynthesis protein NifB n=1 Tax=Frankliniella fusca TaxID=407009 RepID=A0AAE1LC86_9NEOP|nr:FeMo cofactor biosynthesis protein NifB [Frankliniella fusca]